MGDCSRCAGRSAHIRFRRAIHHETKGSRAVEVGSGYLSKTGHLASKQGRPGWGGRTV